MVSKNDALYFEVNKTNLEFSVVFNLRYVHNKLPPGRLATLMKAMQPTTGHNEAVHKLYETLQERTAQECPPEQAEVDFDSPLKSVPTPGPHYMQ